MFSDFTISILKPSNKEIKNYLNEIRRLLPINGKKEKQFIDDISSSISEVFTDTDEVTYAQLCTEIGKPTDIIINYFGEIDYSYLKKKMIVSAMLKRVSLVLIIVVAALGIFKAFLIYNAYREAIYTNVSKEVVVIE